MIVMMTTTTPQKDDSTGANLECLIKKPWHIDLLASWDGQSHEARQKSGRIASDAKHSRRSQTFLSPRRSEMHDPRRSNYGLWMCQLK